MVISSQPANQQNRPISIYIAQQLLVLIEIYVKLTAALSTLLFFVRQKSSTNFDGFIGTPSGNVCRVVVYYGQLCGKNRQYESQQADKSQHNIINYLGSFQKFVQNHIYSNIPYICLLLEQDPNQINGDMPCMEIDLSKLSETQKRFYVQLLANSNLQFHKENNQFVAQFRVDANRLTPTPTNPDHKQKKSKTTTSPNKKNQFLPSTKKPLNRVVKIQDFKTLQALHPTVQIYVYPKRIPLNHLQQLIQCTYQRLWQQQKRKTSQLRQLNFSEWLYKNIIGLLKQKLKIEQNLVNLIDSIHHYTPKVVGVKLFYHFLTEKWPIDALFYFLVLRGLLEEVTSDRILEKGQSPQGWSSVLGYRMRYNPNDRNVTQQQVSSFIATLCSGGLSCSKNKAKSFESLFKQLTSKMYFDGKRNIIPFYQLLEQLLLQYLQAQTSSCDMSLSKTQLTNEDQSLSELITDQISHDQTLNKHLPPLVCNYTVELTPGQEESFEQRNRQDRQQGAKEQFSRLLTEKVEDMYSKLGARVSQRTRDGLAAAIQTIGQLDKTHWVQFRQSVTDSQLLSIQRLQSMFRERTQSPQLLNSLVKGTLLLPALRTLILDDIKF